MPESPIQYEWPLVTRIEARERGLKRYFTDIPCNKYDHVCQRFTSNGNCVECNKTFDKLNKGLATARSVRSYHKNLEANRKAGRERKKLEWINRNDILRKRNKQYYAANKERLQAEVKKWLECNPGYSATQSKKWRTNNLERYRVQAIKYVQKRKYRIKENGGTFTFEQIERMAKNQHSKCPVCKKKFVAKFEIDHVKPLSKGGTNSIENIQLLCRPCNRAKSNKDPIGFMQSLGYLL